MSAMLRLPGLPGAQRIFVWYNFHQVRDVVLLIFFSEKTNRHEKIFIYKDNNRWETDILKSYTGEKAYNAIFRRLQDIFEIEDGSMPDGPGIERIAEHYSNFLTGVN